jgi:glycosyltransferase involved in cell wall biosynthesis
MPTIRFSIIITFCNQRAFINDAVDTALSLVYPEKEVIAVDDGSTDGSAEVLRQYGNRIRLVCHEVNQGACAARNHGAEVASGEYLVFLDGDDAFLPWALDVYERIVMERKPKLILGEMQWFMGTLPPPSGVTPNQMRVVEYKDYLRRDRTFGNSASALVIDRQQFEEVHGWPTDLFPCDDHDIALKLGTSGRTVQILEPPTVFHRAHYSSTTQNLSACFRAVYRFVQKEKSAEYPGGKPRSHERHALIGGVVFFFMKRAAKSGLYMDAIKLLVHGWRMVLAAVTLRLGVILRGRQPCETIKL